MPILAVRDSTFSRKSVVETDCGFVLIREETPLRDCLGGNCIVACESAHEQCCERIM